MTGLVVVETSDLMLALGIKFWAGIIEKQNIQDLEECHHIINIIQNFLLANSHVGPDDKEEAKVSLLEKPDDEDEYETSLATEDGDDDDSDQIEKTVEEDLTDLNEDTIEPEETEMEKSDEITVDKKENDEKENITTDDVKKTKTRKEKFKFCDYCNVSFPKFKILTEHVSAQHSEKLGEFEKNHKRFVCPHCPAKYYYRVSLMSHLKSAHDRTVKCTVCDKTFHTELQLRKHQKASGHVGFIKCETCGKEFSCHRKYLKHLRRHKTGICTVCGKTFSLTSLQRHIQTHSQDSFRCEPCGRELVGHRRYLRHLRIHQEKSGEDLKTELECKDCGLVLRTRNSMQLHRFKEHNFLAVFCPVCGKKFYGTTLLNRHLGSHEESKEIECDQCDKKFKSQYNLNRHHQRVHRPDSEKRYKCSFADCTKAFTIALSLRNHMNSHLGLKPYKCHICDTRFQNTSNRAAHLRNVHK